MYKKFFMGIAAMAALTLVSCSSDDLNSLSDNSSKNEAISFDGYLGRSAVAVNGSRGSVLDLNALKGTDSDKKGFGVFGYYNSSVTDHGSAPEQSFDANLFNNEQVTCLNGAADWSYTPLKYWPAQGHIDFYAYAPFETGKTLNKKTSATSTTTTPTFNFTVVNKVADQTDLLWANAENKTKEKNSSPNKVKFQFAHALSKLGYTVKLNKAVSESEATITLKNITLAGSSDGTSKKAFYKDGTINLAKATDATDATGLWKAVTSDDNKQNFNWSSSNKTLNNAVSDAEIKNPDNEYLFVIPQDFSAGNANNDELYVIVEYTIEYKSGSAKPTVSYNVSKQLKNNFLQGKAYTINLTIGLTPIEFDADVTTWENGATIPNISWE